MRTKTRFRSRSLVLLIVCVLATPVVLAAPGGGGEEPARVTVSVAPDAIAPGGQGEVTVRIVPNQGIKINRYPRIKLQIPAREGLVAEAEASVGNDSPPPADRMETNYFDRVDPVKLLLPLDPAASAGRHEIDARLTYYYCVAASGYCAPKKIALTIPVTVR